MESTTVLGLAQASQQASQEAIDNFLSTVKPSEFWRDEHQEGPENRECEWLPGLGENDFSNDLLGVGKSEPISFEKGDTINCKNTSDNKGCPVPDDEYKVVKIKEKYLVLKGMNTGVCFRGDRQTFENMCNTSLV
jgi:hypothetical protein